MASGPRTFSRRIPSIPGVVQAAIFSGATPICRSRPRSVSSSPSCPLGALSPSQDIPPVFVAGEQVEQVIHMRRLRAPKQLEIERFEVRRASLQIQGSRLCIRKGEVFAYVGLPQNLKELKDREVN